MTRKVHLIVNLQSEAVNLTIVQIEERIRNEANIPWCKDIEKVAIEDVETTYRNWEKQGISKKAARALMDLYTQ